LGEKKYLLFINDENRRKQYNEIFDGDFVPIISPKTHLGTFKGETKNFFKLDLDSVTYDQRQKIIEQISKRFNLDILKVSRLIDFQGVPIHAKDCVVYVAERHTGKMIEQKDPGEK